MGDSTEMADRNRFRKSLGKRATRRIGGTLPLVGIALAAVPLLGAAEAQGQAGGSPSITYTSETTSVKNGFFLPFSFEVPCPAGTVVLGGGYIGVYQSLFVTQSAPAGDANSWQVSGQNDSNGSGSTNAKGYASCAPEVAFPTGSLTYPEPVSRELKPWPLKPRSGSVSAPCPAGQVPIAGGFEAQDETLELSVAASYAEVSDTEKSGGWVVYGENTNVAPFNIESWDLTASATCLDAQIAFGVFQFHGEEKMEKVNDPKTVAASCSHGQAISGGFFAYNGKGSKLDTDGVLYFMDFDVAAGTGAGYQIGYVSTATDSHKFTTLVYCGDIFPAVGTLGKADFDAACQAALPDSSGVEAAAGRLATDWTCVGDDVAATPVPGNQGVWACERAYDPVHPTATYLRRGDPLSWVCYDSVRETQLPVTKLEGSASGVDAKGRRGQVRIKGRARISRPLGNLNRARVTLASTLLEATAHGDLLEYGRGRDTPPVILRAPRSPKAGAASGIASKRWIVLKGGKKPRLKLRLRRKPGKSLRFDLRARRRSIDAARLCDSGPRATTSLTTRFLIDGGKRSPAEVLADAYWRCRGKRLVTAGPALPSG